MDYYLASALFVFLQTFTSFYSSAIRSFSLDSLSKEDTDKMKKIIKLQDDFREKVNPFIFLEMLLMVVSLSFFCLAFREQSNSSQDFLYYLPIPVILILFFRSFAVAYGRRFSDFIVGKMSKSMLLLYKLGKPFYFIFEFIINKFGATNESDSSLSDLHAQIDESLEDGTLEDREYRILKNIINFGSIQVSDVMTPRTVTFSCDAELTVKETLKYSELQLYSRFPIWEGDSLDQGVIGYVMTKDVLHAALQGKLDKKLSEFKRDVYYIPENAELDKALDQFLERRQHLFVCVDEYGGVEGLLTMEDVMETILGVEIVDEADKVVDLREYAKQKRDERIASIAKLEK